MKFLLLVAFIMTTAIGGQSEDLVSSLVDGAGKLVSNPIGTVGKVASGATKTLSTGTKQLQATNFCKCIYKGYEDHKYATCRHGTGTGNQALAKVMAKDTKEMLVRCTPFGQLPGIDALLATFPSLVKLHKKPINGKEQCDHVSKTYDVGKFVSCKTSGPINPVQLLNDFKKNTIHEE